MLSLRKALLVLAFTILLASHYNVFGCFDPFDWYSVEVVLNKPGIVYNLSILERIPNINVLNTSGDMTSSRVYIYRSHFNNSFVVVVAETRLYGDKEYLSIRVEPVPEASPAKKVYYARYEATIRNSSLDNVVDSMKEFFNSYGWIIKDFILKKSDYEYITRRYLYITAYKNFSKYNVDLSIYMYNITRTITKVSLYFTSNGVSKEIVNETSTFVSQITGVDVELKYDLGEVMYVEPPSGYRYVIKSVLKYELIWLRDIGVVKGLSDSDIDSIVSIIEPGNAGWNSRLVYDMTGKWIVYHDAKLPVITITTGGGCSISYSEEDIPKQPPPLYIQFYGLAMESTIESASTNTSAIAYGESPSKEVEYTTSPLSTVSSPTTIEHIMYPLLVAITVSFIVWFILRKYM